MRRYLVEREFPQGLDIPAGVAGVEQVLRLRDNNLLDKVVWLHSYLSDDRRRLYCICDAATPEAIRRAAARNGLPVTRICEVRVLDPYLYFEAAH